MILDFIIAFLIFLTIFLINFYSWDSIERKIINTEDKYYFKSSVYQAVESLIKTKGEPINWEINPSSAEFIGLAGSENTLSNDKLAALNNSAYNLLKDAVLPTGDYQINIMNDSNLVFTTGSAPQGSRITRVERLVRINNTNYKFVFKGWVE